MGWVPGPCPPLGEVAAYGRWGLLLWPAFCGHCRLGEAVARPSVRGCSGAGRSGWGLGSGPAGLGLPRPARRCCGPGSSPETLSSSCVFRVHSRGPASAAACPSNSLSLTVCVFPGPTAPEALLCPQHRTGAPLGQSKEPLLLSQRPPFLPCPPVPGLPSCCAGARASPASLGPGGLACGCVRSPSLSAPGAPPASRGPVSSPLPRARPRTPLPLARPESCQGLGGPLFT